MTWELTPELSDKICLQLSEGKSLVSICAQEGMPNRSSVLLWVVKGERGEEKYKAFSDSYARAREAQAHALIDEVIEIADDNSGDVRVVEGKETMDGEFVARSRIKIDTRFKVAARMHHKKFGERQILAGDEESPLFKATDEQLDAKLSLLLGKAGTPSNS